MPRLTQTEQLVLNLMATGYDDAHIARTLNLDAENVRDHSLAIYNNLVPPGDGQFTPRVQAVLAFVTQNTAASLRRK